MSGHNKWSKIKHKKAATDSKKSAEFSKFAQLIAFESKKVGGDVNSPGLKIAIERAKKINMPNDNIDRAISKGVGGKENTEEVFYEAYGPAGVAMIIFAITDNKNRTVGEVKNILNKQGLSLAEQGAASWAFEKEGSEWKPKTKMEIDDNSKEKVRDLTEKLKDIDDVQEVFTNI